MKKWIYYYYIGLVWRSEDLWWGRPCGPQNKREIYGPDILKNYIGIDGRRRRGHWPFEFVIEGILISKVASWQYPKVKSGADLHLKNPFEDVTAFADEVRKNWCIQCEKAVGTYLGPGPATIILDIRGQDSVRATRYVAQKKAETKRRIAEIFQRKRRIASDIYHREVADLLFPSLITNGMISYSKPLKSTLKSILWSWTLTVFTKNEWSNIWLKT